MFLQRLSTSSLLLRRHRLVASTAINHLHNNNSNNKSPLSVCRLRSRSSLLVSGKESAQFLQGLLTNDIAHLTCPDVNNNNNNNDNEEEEGDKKPQQQQQQQHHHSMYSLFLNTAGRIAFDAVVFLGHEPDQFVLDCDAATSDDLLKHLSLYRVRRKIDLRRLEDRDTFVVFAPLQHREKEVRLDLPHDSLCTVDQRTPRLGYRVLLNQSGSKDLLEAVGCEESPERDYAMLRHQLGVPEGSAEIPPGKCFPLEYNADYMHGVSFQKGCYIGQELTARVQHTGVVRKRIMPLRFKFDDDNDDKDNEKESILREDADLVDQTGRKVGKVRGVCGEYGLGLMRMKEAGDAEEIRVAGGDKASSSVRVRVFRPDWWPIEAPKKLVKKKEEAEEDKE